MESAIALRPIDPELGEVLDGALRQRAVLAQVAAVAAQAGELIFVGAGGSWASSVPAHFLINHSDSPVRCQNIQSGEFITAPPPQLGARTVVVASSHTGATPETVEAANLARSRGAVTVSLARDADNPLANASQLHLTYGSDRTITPAKHMLLGQLAELLCSGSGQLSQDVIDTYDRLPSALQEASVQSEPWLSDLAVEIGRHDTAFVLGSGPNFGLSYLLSMCYLMEMQWMHSACFNSGEFFHGAFEMAEEGTPVVVLLGEDDTRPLGERAVRFLDRYVGSQLVLDSRDLALSGVLASARPRIAHMGMSIMIARLIEHLEFVRQHDLGQRRYMHKVEY